MSRRSIPPILLAALLSTCTLGAVACAPSRHDTVGEPVWTPTRRLTRAPRAVTVPLRRGAGAGFEDLGQSYPLPKGELPVGPGELEIYAVNTRERVRVRVYNTEGKLDVDALDVLANVFRDQRTERHHPINRRLVAILYTLGQLYGRPLHLISGYRHPKHIKKRMSRHATAQAADILVPGVPEEDVFQTLRERLEKVGLGVYPTSHFVHVDVRERSYYWVDRSGPGQRKRERRLPVEPRVAPGTDWTVHTTQLPPGVRRVAALR